MNGDKFDYIYDQGRWVHDDGKDDRLTIGQIVETVLSLFALAVCLVAVIILFLSG